MTGRLSKDDVRSKDLFFNKYPSKSLVIHHGALGDVLLSIPAIIKTKEIFQTDIHLCSQVEIGRLLEQLGVVDECSDIESSFYSSLYAFRPSRSLVEFIRYFDRVYYYTAKKDSETTALLSNISRNFKAIHSIPSENIHVATYRLRQIDPNIQKAETVRFNLSAEKLKEASSLLESKGYRSSQGLVVMHPGSGSPKKNIPISVFLETAEYLIRSKDRFVVFLTGPAESDELISKVKDFGRSNYACHLHNRPLIDLPAIMALSTLYIGNDSGISHLAGFFAQRLIVFFCSTDPQLWSPLSNNLTIINSEHEETIKQKVFGL